VKLPRKSGRALNDNILVATTPDAVIDRNQVKDIHETINDVKHI